jgi:hypothetical protein
LLVSWRLVIGIRWLVCQSNPMPYSRQTNRLTGFRS